MEDYTKFKLKRKDELAQLLEQRDNWFVVACNKCFKEFTAEEEPESGELHRLAAAHGRSVAGSASIDFLCNKKARQTGWFDGPLDIFSLNTPAQTAPQTLRQPRDGRQPLYIPFSSFY